MSKKNIDSTVVSFSIEIRIVARNLQDLKIFKNAFVNYKFKVSLTMNTVFQKYRQ